MKYAAVIGYSGHAYVVIDILLSNEYKLLGYFEKDIKNINPYSLDYLGDEENIDLLKKIGGADFFIGIGNNNIRANIFDYLISIGLKCPYVIHKNAHVSAMAALGLGTIVMPGAVINTRAMVGNAVICNSSAIIEHECRIGDYTHIAPGAVLAGNVAVGENCFIGANAVIKQGITIGNNVIVGAGAVVTKDIENNKLVYGNPARSKK